jgi:hypothetical protein
MFDKAWYMMQEADKHMGTRISLAKQLGLSVTILNIIISLKEMQNSVVYIRLFFEEVNSLLILYQDFHDV